MTKNMSIFETWSFTKFNYLINRVSITNYFVDFSVILIGLKLV